MYRCASAAIAAAILFVPASESDAQSLRSFPATAMRGALVVVAPPEVTLNDKPGRLGAGARIRGQDNLVKMPASLVGGRFLVHYTLDGEGLLRDVWILTSDEAGKRPWPSTPQDLQTWSFDPVAQTWAKP